MISKKDLIEVTFAITNKCNLKCPWCFEKSSLKEKEKLSLEAIFYVFQKLKGLKAINLSGGEIFLRNDIKNLLHKAVVLFPKVHLITNGTLIPRYFIPFFKKYNISFSISIDGPKPVHEKIRGINTFDRTISNIKLLRDNGLYVNMQATISRLNLNFIENLILLGTKLRVSRISFMRLKAIGRASRYIKFLLNRKETEALNKNFSILIKKYKDIHVMLKDSFVNTLNISLVNKMKEMGSHCICGGCRAGMEMLYITNAGEIYPCPFLRISLGNIFRDDIWNIWLYSSILQDLRSKEKYIKCSKCKYWQICRGCRAESLRVSKNYLGPDPYCWR